MTREEWLREHEKSDWAHHRVIFDGKPVEYTETFDDAYEVALGLLHEKDFAPDLYTVIEERIDGNWTHEYALTSDDAKLAY